MKARRSAHPPAVSIGPSRTALLAVIGSSPAVLTETLWALARETPPVIPHTVAVVTTTIGRAALEQQLLAPMPLWKGRTVWQALRAALLGKNAGRDKRLQLVTPTVIALPDAATGTFRELDDIRTGHDNTAAAEAILAAVRHITTDADTRLIGLLAGGRKTMGALLHAAMSLAGRHGDRLLHVLVNEPFDHPQLKPPFFFCGQPGPGTHTLPSGSIAPLSAARIELADVPLVALGELITAQSGQLPATFASLARAADSAIDNAKATHATLTLAYDLRSRQLRVDHYVCEIPAGRPAALIAALMAEARADSDLADRKALEARWGSKNPRTGQPKFTYVRPDGTPSAFTEDDISNALNVVRDTLQTKGQAPRALVERLFPRRQAIGLNRDRVTIAE